MTVGQQNSHAPCMLKSLSHPLLNGALPGLIYSGTHLDLNKDDFACCGGTGQSAGSVEGATVNCDLRNRIQRVRRTIMKFQNLWNYDSNIEKQSGGEFKNVKHNLPLEIPTQDASDVIGRLQRHAAGRPIEECRGRMLSKLEGPAKPGFVWAVALTAVWRFGIDVHIFSFGRSKYEHLLPKVEQKRPMICFVENIDGLWDARNAELLEQIVSFCDRAMIPIWPEFILRKNDRSAAKSSIVRQRKAMFDRIEKLKSQSPLNWVDPSTRSRFPSMTEGLEKLIRPKS